MPVVVQQSDQRRLIALRPQLGHEPSDRDVSRGRITVHTYDLAQNAHGRGAECQQGARGGAIGVPGLTHDAHGEPRAGLVSQLRRGGELGQGLEDAGDRRVGEDDVRAALESQQRLVISALGQDVEDIEVHHVPAAGDLEHELVGGALGPGRIGIVLLEREGGRSAPDDPGEDPDRERTRTCESGSKAHAGMSSESYPPTRYGLPVSHK